LIPIPFDALGLPVGMFNYSVFSICLVVCHYFERTFFSCRDVMSNYFSWRELILLGSLIWFDVIVICIFIVGFMPFPVCDHVIGFCLRSWLKFLVCRLGWFH
jgi:hypothetical protein